jgi:hypothetical protein
VPIRDAPELGRITRQAGDPLAPLNVDTLMSTKPGQDQSRGTSLCMPASPQTVGRGTRTFESIGHSCTKEVTG